LNKSRSRKEQEDVPVSGKSRRSSRKQLEQSGPEPGEAGNVA